MEGKEGHKISSRRKSILAFKRATRWLQGAKRALEDERWDDVVYNSQMAVEHGVKSILLEKGYRFKRVHDVSQELFSLPKNYNVPSWFAKKIDEITKIMLKLTNRRTSAGYGFEEEYDVDDFKDEAPSSYKEAEYVLDLISKYYIEIEVDI